MDDTQTPSQSTPHPEGPKVAPQPVDPAWALKTGLLHFVNEAGLWPLGFGLVLARDGNGTVGLLLVESDGPIVPEIDSAEHLATHLAFMAMLANRFTPTEESPAAKAAKEARARLVLPS
jgi:hypothetical protein